MARELRDVVVGVDGSEPSRRALDRALRMGQESGRTVRVVYAFEVPPLVVGLGPEYLYDAEVSTAEARVAATLRLEEEVRRGLARRRSSSRVLVRPVAVEGPTGPVLVEQSKDAAVLVLGTRAHGRVASMIGAAVPHALHHAACPVLVVPRGATAGAPFGKVVVGFDGSDSSRSALRWALHWAAREGAPLTVLHAGESSSFEASERWRREVQLALPGTPLDHVTVRSVGGRADASLLAAAGQQDLLVVGSRGTGGFTGLLLGSVSAYCVAHPIATLAVVRAGAEQLDDVERELDDCANGTC